MKGVDAKVELIAELDRLSGDPTALQAPRSAMLYRYLAEAQTAGAGLATHLILRLGVWWSPAAYAQLPVMTPWCVRDRSCRYDQGPEAWGAPRDDGFLRDDNSIIKKLPLPVVMRGPAGHAFTGQKPWRGFTACHIWRDLPGGRVAGEDPWLYSFMPNLVWLPTWLAPLTDRQGSPVQALLQRTSLELFRHQPIRPEVASFAGRAWEQLDPPCAGAALPIDQLVFFEPHADFFRRRIAYLSKFVDGCDAVLAGAGLSKKLICTRYTVGLPALRAEAVASFRDQLASYRDAVMLATA